MVFSILSAVRLLLLPPDRRVRALQSDAHAYRSVSILIKGDYMSATQTSFTGRTTSIDDSGSQAVAKRDVAESMLKTVDKSTQKATGISLFHILTLGSIGASIALYLSGKETAGIFIGLWPPTFQALKAVVDKGNQTA